MAVLQNITVLLRLESSQYSQGMARAIVATKQFDRSIKAAAASSTAVIGGLSRTAEGLGLIVGTAGAAALKMAIEFESAFTGVLKTVEGTDQELAAIRTGILDMSEVLPASANEIAAVAEQAGQLGIESQNVLDFTKVMIDMGESTNLSANDAAQALARFFNIMQTGPQYFDNLGSSIVDLGNNFATTEREITDIALRLAGAGRIVGLTEADVLALSTAASSIGIAPERAGTALQRTLAEIDKAVKASGEDLQSYAEITQQSASSFAAAWRDEPINVVLDFLDGLQRITDSGGDTYSTLDELGLRGIRVQQTLTGLAAAGDLTASAVERSGAAWKENTALAEEAGRRYATTESQLRAFGNTLRRELIDVGTERLPVLLALLEENADELPKILGDLADAGLNLFESLSKGIPLLEALAIIVSRIPPDLIALGISIGFVSRFSRALVGPLNLILAGMGRFPALATQTRLGWSAVSASVFSASTALSTAATRVQATERVFKGTSLEGLYGGARRAAIDANRAAGLSAAGFTAGLPPPPKNAAAVQSAYRNTGRAAGAAGAAARGASIGFGALTLGLTVAAVGVSEINQGLSTSARKSREAEGSIKEWSRAITAATAEGRSFVDAVGPAFEFEGFPDTETTLDLDFNVFRELGEVTSAVQGEFQLTSDLLAKAGLDVQELGRLASQGGAEYEEAIRQIGAQAGNLGNLALSDTEKNFLEFAYGGLTGVFNQNPLVGNILPDILASEETNVERAAEEFQREIRTGMVESLRALEDQGSITVGTLGLLETAANESVSEFSDFDTIATDLVPKIVAFNEAVGSGLKDLGIDPRLNTIIGDLALNLESGRIEGERFAEIAREIAQIEGVGQIQVPDEAISALSAAVGAASDPIEAQRSALQILRRAGRQDSFDAVQFQRSLSDIGPNAAAAALGVDKWNQSYQTAVDLGRQPFVQDVGAERVAQSLEEYGSALAVAETATNEYRASMESVGFTAVGVEAALEEMADSDADAGALFFRSRTEIDQFVISAAFASGSMERMADAANLLDLTEQDLIDTTEYLREEVAKISEAFWGVVPGVESAMTFMRERLQEQYDLLSDETREGISFDDFAVDRSSLGAYAEGLRSVSSGQREAFQFALNIEKIRQGDNDDLARAIVLLAEEDRETAFKFADEAVRIGPQAAREYESLIEEIEVGDRIVGALITRASQELSSTNNRLLDDLQRPHSAARDEMVKTWGDGATAIIGSLTQVSDAVKGLNFDSEPPNIEAGSVQNVFTALDTSEAEFEAELQLTANPDIDFGRLRETRDGRILIESVLAAAKVSPSRASEIIGLPSDQEFAAAIAQVLRDIDVFDNAQLFQVLQLIPGEQFLDTVTKVNEITSDKEVHIDYVLTYRTPTQEDQRAEEDRLPTPRSERSIGGSAAQARTVLESSGPSGPLLDLLQRNRRLAEGLPEFVQRAMLEASGVADKDIEVFLSGNKEQLELALSEARDSLRAYEGEEANANLGAEVDEGSVQSALDYIAARAAQATVSVPIYATLSEQARKFFADNTFVAGSATLQAELNRANALASADGGLVDFYAKGGMRDQPHVAQIAPAGTWRVWAEPETGGEAYIPLASSKRNRSESILNEVARRFGYSLVSAAEEERLRHRGKKFADGGIVNAQPIRPVVRVGNDRPGPTTTQSTITNRTQFLGDMVMTDPRAAVEYAERQRRKNALIGVA